MMGCFGTELKGGAASTTGRPRLYAPTDWDGGSSFSHSENLAIHQEMKTL